MERHSASITEV